jgi:hypothetical protein
MPNQRTRSACEDAQQARQPRDGDGVGHLAQRQVGGGQGHPQRRRPASQGRSACRACVGGQQHHHLLDPAGVAQVLGVAAEAGMAGIEDHPLVQRAR